ncbi:hypothetical protein N656DRAFT_789614 [Canariomyces notabilis]|uniref:Uncharacterized protein n=1 Tax=Canariomyces notabilis TaxID=2074819 RepID=A0AAN6TDJ8_9PEZI|nr:hypothetical protein N656DRAFT_789614 [Canariomyces arenarius]
MDGTPSASPTPRDIRRLASDHDFVLGAHPTPRRLGLWPFLVTHLSLIASLGAGIIFVVVAIAYTSVISEQMLECPSWANGCTRADAWTVENLGTIQGIITLIYLLGMVALGYSALGLCEATVWPLLHQQSFTIGGLDAYLATTRGSIMSVPAAIMAVRSLSAGLVLAAALAVTLLPLAAPPLVGHAFTPVRQPVQLESNYTPGGGIGELYAQTNPPTSVMVRMLVEYDSWATSPSSEPLSHYRDWYIDRETLKGRGNFSANAVRLQTSISCRPHTLQQLRRENAWWNAFLTNMTRSSSNSTQTGDNNTNAEVWVRPQSQLTLWADSFDFLSDRRTQTTLILAALNGTIEGGSVTPVIVGTLTSASAIACDVEIEAIDDILSVGSEGPVPTENFPVLSSTSDLTVSRSVSPDTRLNELLLWFTVAPLLASSSVDGTQPMFANSSSTHRPVALTTSATTTTIMDSNTDTNTWTIPGLSEFIHVSIGALAQATSSNRDQPNLNPSTVTIRSETLTRKLSPSRAKLLTILPATALTILVLMTVYTAWLHARLAIPVMRPVSLGELLKSAQTAWLRDTAGTDAAKTYLPNELGRVWVRYGVDADGMAGLGSGFRGLRCY